MALPKLILPNEGYAGPFGKSFKSKNGEGKDNNAKTWTIDLAENKENTGQQDCNRRNYQLASKKNVKKKRELSEAQKREMDDWRILVYVHLSSIIHTFVLLLGKEFISDDSSTAGVLVSSIFCTKLLTYVKDKDSFHGAGHKTIIALMSSAIGYCFNSRSIEKLGGVYLAFVHFMAL